MRLPRSRLSVRGLGGDRVSLPRSGHDNPSSGIGAAVMSYAMYVILEGGPIPEGALPPEQGCGGQNLRCHRELSELAEGLGLIPLDDFVVEHSDLLNAELERILPPLPAPPQEGGEDEIPFDESWCIDAVPTEEYLRAVRQAEATLPWFSPGDGLRTVLGLLRLISSSPELEERFYGVTWDLEDFASQLAYAEREGLRFHLGES